MRAIVVTKPGGPEVLELREVPTPEPRLGEVRVKIHACGVNRADLLQRLGAYPAPPGSPQDVPGLEIAGEVDALGPRASDVSSLEVGDKVFGVVGGGAYAEAIVVHARTLAKMPAGTSFVDAAALPEAFVTAYDAMVVQCGLRAGETVLVHAAGSGVGTAAIQIARAIGAIPIGTARTAAKLERAKKEVGLDRGVVPRDGAFATDVKTLTNGRGVDVVLDLVGGAYVPEGLAALADRGRLIVVGLVAGTRAEVDLAMILRRRLTIIGTNLRARPLEEKILAARVLGENLAPLFASGALKPVIDTTMPLADARVAHERMTANDTFGKIVLVCQ